MAHDATAKRTDRATHALEAYERSAFPGEPSLLRHDSLYAEALLTALVCDLGHYATSYGIDFSEVVSTGRSIHAEEVAEQTTYKVGDQVRLTRHDDRCGTIIGWTSTTPNTETTFLIEVPGIPYLYAEPGTRLAPAPQFPPTETSLGAATHADQAEQLYAKITARLSGSTASTRHSLEQDCHKLLAALSSWSGVSPTRLQRELAPRPSATSSQPATLNQKRRPPQPLPSTSASQETSAKQQ